MSKTSFDLVRRRRQEARRSHVAQTEGTMGAQAITATIRALLSPNVDRTMNEIAWTDSLANNGAHTCAESVIEVREDI